MAKISGILISLLSIIVFINGKSVEEFMEARNEVLKKENDNYLGSDLILTEKEDSVNLKIKVYKINLLSKFFIIGLFFIK